MEILTQFNQDIIDKFQAITGIQKRRYADNDQKASDLAAEAGLKAIESAGINKEELDYIIVSHNFGDVEYGTNQYIALPSVATMVKHKMNIKNINCVAYDLIFGCPGWLRCYPSIGIHQSWYGKKVFSDWNRYSI